MSAPAPTVAELEEEKRDLLTRLQGHIASYLAVGQRDRGEIAEIMREVQELEQELAQARDEQERRAPSPVNAWTIPARVEEVMSRLGTRWWPPNEGCDFVVDARCLESLPCQHLVMRFDAAEPERMSCRKIADLYRARGRPVPGHFLE